MAAQGNPRDKKRFSTTLVVRARSLASTRGLLIVGEQAFPCALGRGGRRAAKREGDGATPIGCWPVRGVRYRPDRGLPPATGLIVRPMRPDDGWCDERFDRNYNRPVRHPYPTSAEPMWRADNLYDVVVVLGYNDGPRTRGLGSAIFMHLARPDYAPTAGCIALSRRDLRLVLARLRPGARVRIMA